MAAGGSYTLNTIDRHAVSFQERAGKPGGARESLSRVSEQGLCQRLITNQCCSVDVYNQTVEKSDISGTVTDGVGDPSRSGSKVMETIQIERATDRDAVLTSVAVRLDNTSAPPIGGIEVSPTINSTDRHGVASVDCRNGTENENVNVTLQAKANGGQSLNCGTVIWEKK